MMKRRVEFAETDASGRAHFTSMLRWVEEAEHQFLEQRGIEVFGLGVGWPRVRVECDYRIPALYGELMEVSLKVDKCGESSVTWSFEIRKDGETVVASGQMVTVNIKEGERSPLDEEQRTRLLA